jgi:hypothetical protein
MSNAPNRTPGHTWFWEALAPKAGASPTAPLAPWPFKTIREVQPPLGKQTRKCVRRRRQASVFNRPASAVAELVSAVVAGSLLQTPGACGIETASPSCAAIPVICCARGLSDPAG